MGVLASNRVSASVSAPRAMSAACRTAPACWTCVAESGAFGNAWMVAVYAARTLSNSADEATIRLAAALTGYQYSPPYASSAMRIGIEAMRRRRDCRPRPRRLAARCG